jgi:hypothetical protein
MAYNGAKLSRMTQGQLGAGFALWHYDSTDAVTAVRVAGYVSDAAVRGMRKGDLVMVTDVAATPPRLQLMIVSAISAGGAGDLSDGLAVTATNTD